MNLTQQVQEAARSLAIGSLTVAQATRLLASCESVDEAIALYLENPAAAGPAGSESPINLASPENSSGVNNEEFKSASSDTENENEQQQEDVGDAAVEQKQEEERAVAMEESGNEDDAIPNLNNLTEYQKYAEAQYDARFNIKKGSFL